MLFDMLSNAIQSSQGKASPIFVNDPCYGLIMRNGYNRYAPLPEQMVRQNMLFHEAAEGWARMTDREKNLLRKKATAAGLNYYQYYVKQFSKNRFKHIEAAKNGCADASEPDHAYVGEPFIYLEGCGTLGNCGSMERIYLYFNISAFPRNFVALEAILQIYQVSWEQRDPTGQTVSLHRVTSHWDEGSLTWNNEPSFDPTPIAWSRMPGNHQVMRFDVTRDVNYFLEHNMEYHGWVICNNIRMPLYNTGHGVFASRYNTEYPKPTLLIRY
ncbi:MAG: hypothetical protein DRP50_05330 [Thermotoga sp.]|nr:MAG: hypothetical protein DRP50_05330 [Thermotoga sp.]